jgi:serine/threonine-protein kinase
VSQDPLLGDYVEPGTPIDLHVAAADVGVPDLAGLGLVDARTVLAGRSLELGLVTQDESEKAAGTVLAQVPKPNLRVARGSVVDVTVAVPRTVKVPSVVGVDVEKAKAVLDEVGLRLGSADGRASVEPRGAVISQSPTAGAIADVGSPIAVVVSLGGIVRAEPVPDVLGLSRADALARLEGWVPVVVAVVDDGVELDAVVKQTPEGGAVTTNRSVELAVSGSGAPVVDVSGIGAATSAKLARIGIRTVGDLVVASSDVVADATGFSVDRVRELQAMAAELQSRS